MLKAIKNQLTKLRDVINNAGSGTDGWLWSYDHSSAKTTLIDPSTVGVTDHGALTGKNDDDHTQYILAAGSRAGATTQAQTFTNGLVVGSVKPASDSATAFLVEKASGGAIVTVDSVNQKLIVQNTVNARTIEISSSNGAIDCSDTLHVNRFSGEFMHIGASSDGRMFLGQHVVPVGGISTKFSIGSESTSVGGMAIGGPRTGTWAKNALEIGDYFQGTSPHTLNTTLFAIGPAGEIKSNQTATNTNTPSGGTSHQLAIYDESGTLIGYIPVYGSAW